jgi:hypothetical protein
VRPSVISPEIARKIADLRRQPHASARSIHRHLEAAGHRLSWRTVQRHLERVDADADRIPEVSSGPAVAPANGTLESVSIERLESDLRSRYVESCSIADSLRSRAHLGSRETRRWIEASRHAAELGRHLAAIAPPPKVDPSHDPANVAAHRQLLQNAAKMLERAGHPVPEFHLKLIGLKP